MASATATRKSRRFPVPASVGEKAALLQAINYRWSLQARPSQLWPASDTVLRIWLLMTGRGWGKTRTGAETVRQWATDGRDEFIHLIGPTAGDVRDVMIEGESGLLRISPPWFRPKYEPSKRRVTWPNGVQARLFTADEPERLRGPQCSKWWADEICAWRYQGEAWDNMEMNARLGRRVIQGIVTTTPKPQKFLKELVARKDVHVTTGTTRENWRNLSSDFMEKIYERYGNTRLGQQELAGRLLTDNPRAKFSRSLVDATRVNRADVPELMRIVVGLDPSATTDGDAAGIIVAGKGIDGHYYVLFDRTTQGSPLAWATKAVEAFLHPFGKGAPELMRADLLLYESNQGGEMIPHTIDTVQRGITKRKYFAKTSKDVRADPAVALWEQGTAHIVGNMVELEDEMCEWDKDDKSAKSPNRLDAMVMAICELAHRLDQQKLTMH